MRRLLSNPAVVTTIIAIAVWGLLVAFAPVDLLNYFLRIGIITVCVITLLRWGKTAWRVYWEGAPEPADSAILGIVLTAISYIYYALWSGISRYLGGPDSMMNSVWSAGFPFLALISFALAISATRLKGESPSSIVAFVMAAGVSLGLAATAVGHLLIAKLGGLATVILRAFWHL